MLIVLAVSGRLTSAGGGFKTLNLPTLSLGLLRHGVVCEALEADDLVGLYVIASCFFLLVRLSLRKLLVHEGWGW